MIRPGALQRGVEPLVALAARAGGAAANAFVYHLLGGRSRSRMGPVPGAIDLDRSPSRII